MFPILYDPKKDKKEKLEQLHIEEYIPETVEKKDKDSKEKRGVETVKLYV